MNRVIRKAMLTVAIISLIASALSCPGAVLISQASAKTVTPVYSSAIHVNSNAELDALITSKGWNGTGTYSDPYIIENLNIKANGLGAGIYIGNTTEYLVIRNCTVTGATHISDPYASGGAITLIDVRNCSLANDTCASTNYYGIYLYHSGSNAISANTCSGSSYYGIYLTSSSDYNVITNNTCKSNSYCGIYLHTSSGNTVSNNNCSSNSYYGIYLASDSDDNTVTYNTCSKNSNYGIELYSCSGNTVYGNVLTRNNGATMVYSSSHVQAYDDGTNRWNSTSYGNYWGDWFSPDSNADGIVDSPYVIDGGSGKDRMPLTGVVFSITSPSLAKVYSNSTSSNMTIAGTAIDGYQVTSITWYNKANHRSGSCGNSSAWSATVPLAAGANLITFTMSDDNGHQYVDNVTVVYDRTVPSLAIASPSNNSYVNSSTVKVTWTASDAISGIGNYSVSIDNGSWISVSKTSYSFTDLADGRHTVRVRTYDMAGNYNVTTSAITIDTAAPTATVSPTGKGVGDNAVIVVVFSEKINPSSLKISVGGAAGNYTYSNVTAMFIPTNAWGFSTTYQVNVTAKDLAGNALSLTWKFTTMKDECSISGIVQDAKGVPLANVTVRLSVNETATSDGNGYFEFDNVTSGTYTLTLKKGGFNTLSTSITVAAGENKSLGYLNMTAGGSGGNMTMIIVAVAAVATVAAVVFFFLRKRSK